MFKKIISSLIIFSILMSDLVGWGNRSAFAMIGSEDSDDQRSFIPVFPEERPEQDQSLEDINESKSLIHSDQEPSMVGGEKEHEEEQERKDHIILDLGQGILSSNGGGEGLSLSPSKLTILPITTSSPRKEEEKNLSQDNLSDTKLEVNTVTSHEATEANENALVLTSPENGEEREKETPSEPLSLEKFEEKVEGSLLSNEISPLSKLTTLPQKCHPGLDPGSQEILNQVQDDSLIDLNGEFQKRSIKEQLPEKEMLVLVEQPPSHNLLNGVIEVFLKAQIEEPEKTTDVLVPHEIHEVVEEQKTTSITEEKLVAKDQQEETVSILLPLLLEEKLNANQEKPEKRLNPTQEEPAEKPEILVFKNIQQDPEKEEKKPSLLPKKRPLSFEEEHREKKANLHQGWELVKEESDDEIRFKRKSDGLKSDDSDGDPFEGGIRVRTSGKFPEREEKVEKPSQETTPLLGSKKKEPNSNTFKKEETKEKPPLVKDLGVLNDSDEEESTDRQGESPKYLSGIELPTVQKKFFTEVEKRFSADFNPLNASDKKRVSLPYQDKRGSLPSQGLLINGRDGDSELEDLAEFEGFYITPSTQALNLSPEAQDFLRYVKVRIIDGTLNWKQIFGIGGGIVVGAGVAWPWMIIMFNSLLDVYAHSVDVYYTDYPKNYSNLGFPIVDPNILNAQFQNFNKYLNFNTMMPLIGIPVGISVATKITSVFVDLMRDSIDSFSIQKSMKHSLALLAAKGSTYFGAFFSGLLPVYYLYQSLGCGLYDLFWETNGIYVYGISTDIFFNISASTLTSIPTNCLSQNIRMFLTTAPILFFNTFLSYGHQHFKSVEKWINDYFFSRMDESSFNSTRQNYLTKFKNLKRIIYGLKEDSLDHLYDAVFLNKLKKIEQKFNAHNSFEDLHLEDALHILKVFNTFHNQHKDTLEEKIHEEWKKTWASRIGWGISLVATFGRMIIFQYVIDQLLGTFWTQIDNNGNTISSLGSSIISSVLGFSIAHLSQGGVEKRAVEESLYEILGGKKILDASSHQSLRIGIKVWDYIYGLFNTLPYLVIGLAAASSSSTVNYWINFYSLNNKPVHVGQILFLMSFGFADIFNNAVAFHRSHLNLLNAFDSVLSYYYAFEGYKRDKLIRIMLQFRNLFKVLSLDVLETVDQILSENYNSDINILRENDNQRKLQEQSISLMKDNHFIEVFSKKKLIATGCLSDGETSEIKLLFSEIPLDEGLVLPSLVQKFLRHVKIRIVDETLNWKQKTGIFGGVIAGAAVAWPMMIIIFNTLLTAYAPVIFNFPMNVDNPEVYTKQFQNFNIYINFKTMMALVGIPLGIDAASRTSSILRSLTEDNIQSFAIPKSKNHQWTLIFAKCGLYGGVFFTGILPVYYLYNSLLGCNLQLENYGFFPNNTLYNYTISTDIFLTLSEVVNSPNFGNCSLKWASLSVGNSILFGIGVPFLFFDTVLQYGEQLFTTAEKRINDYFFAEMRESTHLSFGEMKRKEYLTQFKDLIRIIYNLEENELDDLYDGIFTSEVQTTNQSSDINFEDSTQDEALRILKIFSKFHGQHKERLEDEVIEE